MNVRHAIVASLLTAPIAIGLVACNSMSTSTAPSSGSIVADHSDTTMNTSTVDSTQALGEKGPLGDIMYQKSTVMGPTWHKMQWKNGPLQKAAVKQLLDDGALPIVAALSGYDFADDDTPEGVLTPPPGVHTAEAILPENIDMTHLDDSIAEYRYIIDGKTYHYRN